MTGKITVGIIGVGYWGPNLVRNYSEIEDCNLKWVCDLSEPRRAYIHQQWPDVRLSDNCQDILKDTTVDAVIVATPVETHFDVAMAVLSAGKHIFIEKPMCFKSEDDLKILDLADQKGLKVGTGHIFVYHPAVVKMREVIKSGSLGKSFYAFSTRMNPAPSHGNVDVVWDLAVHDISISLFLWGRSPQKVRASGGCFAHDNRVDAATIELYFGDGAKAYHHVGWLTSAKERNFFLAAEGGSMKFDDLQKEKLRITGPAVDTRLDASAQNGHISYAAGKTEVPVLADQEPLKAECRDFLLSIRKNTPMRSDGRFGHAIVRVLEAASVSLKNKGTVQVLEQE
jgi:predicted dehydrogenase